jgi:hypothetical protein
MSLWSAIGYLGAGSSGSSRGVGLDDNDLGGGGSMGWRQSAVWRARVDRWRREGGRERMREIEWMDGRGVGGHDLMGADAINR